MAAEAAAKEGERALNTGVGNSAAEKAHLLQEQQAYDRAVLEAEHVMRTREKVNEMWQSLE